MKSPTGRLERLTAKMQCSPVDSETYQKLKFIRYAPAYGGSLPTTNKVLNRGLAEMDFAEIEERVIAHGVVTGRLPPR
jgi:hypothetical protein